MKKIIMFICVIATLMFTNNAYAADTVYSLNKYDEEKFETIIDSYDKDMKQDGFIAAGTILKETNKIDEEEYDDYQVILVKYDVTGKVKWTFNYGKTDVDQLDSLEYTYDQENKINGYLIVMNKSNDIEEEKSNTSVFVKVDLNGKLVEEKEILLEENSKINKIIAVIDQDKNLNSYIAIGKSDYPFIAKYDANLNLVFVKKYTLENTIFNDISIVRNQKTIDSYVISVTENKEKIINKVIRYDLEGNEVSTLTTNEYTHAKIQFLQDNNGILIYGLTNQVKLDDLDSPTYYLIKYNVENNIEWETIGNIPISKNNEVKLINNHNEYLIMYTNENDKSNEIVKIDFEGNIKNKVKKIKNDYYNITNFNTYNNTIYFIGQITCPEDETCDYDSNSLFIISDQDKVIEVQKKEASSISLVTILSIVAIVLIILVRKKTKEKKNKKLKEKNKKKKR